MSYVFLKELNHPIDLITLALEAKKWFASIDSDGGGLLSEDEIKEEFLRIGIDPVEVDPVMKFAQSECQTSSNMQEMVTSSVRQAKSSITPQTKSKAELDCTQFINVIQYVLGNAIDHFSAADICTLNYLFVKYDTDGSETMDLKEFTKVCLDLVNQSFVFNGPQSLNTMSLEQMDALRRHSWKTRKVEERKAGKEESNTMDDALDSKKEIMNVDGAGSAKESPFVQIYTFTKAQKLKMESICDSIQKVCVKHYNHSDLCRQAIELFAEAKKLNDDDGDNDESSRQHVDRNIVAVTLGLKEMIKKDEKEKLTREKGHQTTLVEWAYRRSDKLIEISAHEEQLRSMFKKQILEIALRLRKEGVINISNSIF